MKTEKEMYLDWFNNFLTIGKFAEHYGITVNRANEIINEQRSITLGNNLTDDDLNYLVELLETNERV